MHLEISRILPAPPATDGAPKSFARTSGDTSRSGTEADRKSFLETFQAEDPRTNAKSAAGTPAPGEDGPKSEGAATKPADDGDTVDAQSDPARPMETDAGKTAAAAPDMRTDAENTITTGESDAEKGLQNTSSSVSASAVSQRPSQSVEAFPVLGAAKQLVETGAVKAEPLAGQMDRPETSVRPPLMTSAAPGALEAIGAPLVAKAEPSAISDRPMPTPIPVSTSADPRGASNILAGVIPASRSTGPNDLAGQKTDGVVPTRRPGDVTAEISNQTPSDKTAKVVANAPQQRQLSSMTLSETAFGMRTAATGASTAETVSRDPSFDMQGPPRPPTGPGTVLSTLAARGPNTAPGSGPNPTADIGETPGTPEANRSNISGDAVPSAQAEGLSTKAQIPPMSSSAAGIPAPGPAEGPDVAREPAIATAAKLPLGDIDAPGAGGSQLRAEIRQVVAAPVAATGDLEPPTKTSEQGSFPRAELKGDASPASSNQNTPSGSTGSAPPFTAVQTQSPVQITAVKQAPPASSDDQGGTDTAQQLSNRVNTETTQTRAQYGLGQSGQTATVAGQTGLTTTAAPSPATVSNKLDTFEDLTLGGPSSATDTSTTRSEIAATAGQRSNPTAQAILAQLQAALPKANGEATEILLNPEELGRVRMTLSGGDGVGSVLLQVERPETLDLIRRNIEQMRAELAEAGWDSVTFNFAQGGSDSSEGSSDRGQSGHTPGSAVPAETAQETPLPASRANASASGLDLRL